MKAAHVHRGVETDFELENRRSSSCTGDEGDGAR